MGKINTNLLFKNIIITIFYIITCGFILPYAFYNLIRLSLIIFKVIEATPEYNLYIFSVYNGDYVTTWIIIIISVLFTIFFLNLKHLKEFRFPIYFICYVISVIHLQGYLEQKELVKNTCESVFNTDKEECLNDINQFAYDVFILPQAKEKIPAIMASLSKIRVDIDDANNTSPIINYSDYEILSPIEIRAGYGEMLDWGKKFNGQKVAIVGGDLRHANLENIYKDEELYPKWDYLNQDEIDLMYDPLSGCLRELKDYYNFRPIYNKWISSDIPSPYVVCLQQYGGEYQTLDSEREYSERYAWFKDVDPANFSYNELVYITNINKFPKFKEIIKNLFLMKYPFFKITVFGNLCYGETIDPNPLLSIDPNDEVEKICDPINEIEVFTADDYKLEAFSYPRRDKEIFGNHFKNQEFYIQAHKIKIELPVLSKNQLARYAIMITAPEVLKNMEEYSGKKTHGFEFIDPGTQDKFADNVYYGG